MGKLNGDYLSQLFKECVQKHAPDKGITLHCLRHTATDIMEQTGLTDEEIDSTLGHHSVKTALPYYQDRSKDAIARRLSERTRKGIEVLGETICTIVQMSSEKTLFNLNFESIFK